MFLWPSTTPGRVSTSTSFIEARCAWANLMSSMFRRASCDTQSSISRSDRRNAGGFHLSNFSDISRRAVSPRDSMSSRMPVTVSRIFFASALACSGVRPAFRGRVMGASVQYQSSRRGSVTRTGRVEDPAPHTPLADRRDWFGELDIAGRPAVLFGRVSSLVVRFDRVGCGRKHREIPPADDFRRGYRDIPRDRHLDQRRRFRVERPLDGGADVLGRLHFGGNLKAEGLAQRDKIHRVGPPAAGARAELRPDLPAGQVVVRVADRNVSRFFEIYE